MTVDWSRALVLWDPRDKADFRLSPTDFRPIGAQTLYASYRMLEDQGLVDAIKDTKIDAIMFMRNEQIEENLPMGVMLRQLHMGYACVSVIDKEHQNVQTGQCIADLLQGKARVDIPAPSYQCAIKRVKLRRSDLARQSLRTNWGVLEKSGVEGIGECQAEPGGLHSQAEPGNEKRAQLPWFPGSAWEPISSGLRPEGRNERNLFERASVSRPVPWAGGNEGTLYLAFDPEQLGGARFGMPKLRRLLEPSGMRAT